MNGPIYLVEDDTSIRELVVYTLTNTGYEAVGFARGEDFWRAMEKRLPALVILDIMLPGEDGLQILKRIRSRAPFNGLPVMMLTARGSEYDKVLGLDSGADDYLAKPAGMMELTARVKSLLRRAGAAGEKEEYSLGALYVSVPKHKVTVNNKEIILTLKEFNLLVYLLKNAGLALSRDHILDAVWDYDSALETRTVDTHILTLRNKLGPAGAVIRTVRGVGYKAGDSE
jgi:two-component system alkaline phosphatase synthesis response regulator PhoP